MRKSFCLTLVISLCALTYLHAADNPTDTTRLLRFPTTNGQQIVFCYAGELYSVDKAGGVARRLTAGPGYTTFPRFSADGRQLALSSGKTTILFIQRRRKTGNQDWYPSPGNRPNQDS